MPATITVRDVMSTRAIVLHPHDAALDAIETLIGDEISGAPVVDDHGRLCGMLSEIDCHRVTLSLAYHREPSVLTVADLMSVDVHTLAPHTSVLRAAEIFLAMPFRRFPVVDDRDRLLGVISRRDILRATAAAARGKGRFLGASDDKTQQGAMLTRESHAAVGPLTNQRF